MKTKIFFLLFISFLIILISYKTNIVIGQDAHSDFGSQENDNVSECDSQDADWVPRLARRVEAFYEERPADTNGYDWEAAKFLGKKSEYEAMNNYKGLSPLFYNKEVYAGFNGTEQDELFRKDRLLRKWAPNIQMFRGDSKPVSIEKIFDLGTIYITGSKVSLQTVVEISRNNYCRLLLIKQSGSGENTRYLYKVVAKDFEELNTLRATAYAYDALRLRYYPGYDSRLDEAARMKIREEQFKEFKFYKEGNIKRGKEHLELYENNPEKAKRLGIDDPRALSNSEKQKILSDIAPRGKESGGYEVYLSLDKDLSMDHYDELRREAHAYGVMREFRNEDGYEYASLQYHMYQTNSFLPGRILFWYEGGTEKCQIILRRRIGETDAEYRFYGVESSQHKYATSYKNNLGEFTDNMKAGKERFVLYITYGSHESHFIPDDDHLDANQKGSKRGSVFTLSPATREKEELEETELTDKYILHTNYPDNAWIWMGFSPRDKNLHLGAYPVIPEQSGSPLPKYFADIPGKSFFCNPIDHYYYYFRPTKHISKVAKKLEKSSDTVDLVISYGKMYRLLYEVLEIGKPRNSLILDEVMSSKTLDEAVEKQYRLAKTFSRKLKSADGRQLKINEEERRVDTLVVKLRNYIYPRKIQRDEDPSKEYWKGKLGNGKVITEKDISEICNEHAKWLITERKEGQRADLTNADLSDVDLSNANLSEADLSSAKLNKAKIYGANLSYADLTSADLREAILKNTDLSEASLKDAILSKAKMNGAKLVNAILESANLGGAILKGANLSFADLRSASLDDANLTGAKLNEAKLDKASMRKTDLNEANLSGAELKDTVMNEANLSGAILLEKADLSGAKLNLADLREAKMNGAILIKTELNKADLRGANLNLADLSKAKMNGAKLVNAILESANLSGAILKGANLFFADLNNADLSGTDLIDADLSGAILSYAKMSETTTIKGAIFTWADLCMANLDSPSLKDALEKGIELKSVFEKQSTSSDIEPLEKLQVLWGEKNKKPILANFKSYFKEAGLRDLERETTYAIEYGKTDSAPLFVKWVKFIFFELTSGYGLHYIRPLIILFSLIGVFTIVYIFPLIGIGKNGIYRMWSKDRVKKDKVIEERERLIYRIWLKNRFIKTRTNIFKAIGYAFYFSMLSSFHIGWRDLNVGSWIARIQPREYNLKATGWVRTVSGIQSLISIYLLALWVLTQFGRPFE